MSDTPRTDAELMESKHGTYHVVPALFARQLERELAEAVMWRNEWKARAADAQEKIQGLLACKAGQ
jgi:hypothetical protein